MSDKGYTAPSMSFGYMAKNILSWRWWQMAQCLVIGTGTMFVSNYMHLVKGRLVDAIWAPTRSWETILPIFVLMTKLAIFNGACGLYQSYITSNADAYVGLHSQFFVLRKFLKQDTSFYHHPLCDSKKLPTRCSSDTSQIIFLVRDFSFHCYFTILGLIMAHGFIFAGVPVNWWMLVWGLSGHPFIGYATNKIGKYVEVVSVEAATIMSNIGAAMIQIVTNVEFIKLFNATDEAIRVRQREQYRAYDLQREIIQMKTIISLGTVTLKMFINTYVFLLGIAAILDGEMTWGQFSAFQDYLHIIQDKWIGTFQLTVSYRKSIGVARNLIEMLRTPSAIEKEQRGDEYRTERPQFDEMPGLLGSDISQTIKSVRYMKQGLGHVNVTAESCTWYQLRALGVPWKRVTAEGIDARTEVALRAAMPAFPAPCSIEFENVSFYYPKYTLDPIQPSAYKLPRREAPGMLSILDNLSFKIEPAHVTVIAGPNGCGKSTAAKLIERLYDPQQGVVKINGQDIRNIRDIRTWRGQVGMMPQKPPLFMGTVLSNMFFGEGSDLIPEAIQTERRKLISYLLHLTELPFTMDLDEEVGGQRDVSGGQNQKTALTRVIKKPFSLLLFDEPTNNLDKDSLEWLFRFIRTIKEQRDAHVPGAYTPTIVIISHEQEVLRLADKIITLPDTEHSRRERKRRQQEIVANMMEIGMARKPAPADPRSIVADQRSVPLAPEPHLGRAMMQSTVAPPHTRQPTVAEPHLGRGLPRPVVGAAPSDGAERRQPVIAMSGTDVPERQPFPGSVDRPEPVPQGSVRPNLIPGNVPVALSHPDGPSTQTRSDGTPTKASGNNGSGTLPGASGARVPMSRGPSGPGFANPEHGTLEPTTNPSSPGPAITPPTRALLQMLLPGVSTEPPSTPVPTVSERPNPTSVAEVSALSREMNPQPRLVQLAPESVSLPPRTVSFRRRRPMVTPPRLSPPPSSSDDETAPQPKSKRNVPGDQANRRVSTLDRSTLDRSTASVTAALDEFEPAFPPSRLQQFQALAGQDPQLTDLRQDRPPMSTAYAPSPPASPKQRAQVSVARSPPSETSPLPTLISMPNGSLTSSVIPMAAPLRTKRQQKTRSKTTTTIPQHETASDLFL